MNRSEFELALREVAATAGSVDIIVIGSQAIHAAVNEVADRTPEFWASREVDVFVKDRPDMMPLLDERLGPTSSFFREHRFYVDVMDETIPACQSDGGNAS